MAAVAVAVAVVAAAAVAVTAKGERAEAVAAVEKKHGLLANPQTGSCLYNPWSFENIHIST